MADEPIQPDAPPMIEIGPPKPVGPSKTVAVVGILVVILVAGIAIGVRITGPSFDAAATTVRAALMSTLAKHTVALTITESIDVEGQIGGARGKGRCDLHTDTCSATLTYSGALAQLGVETMVYSNRLMYLKLSGTVGASFPTPWIYLPFKASNRPSALGSAGSPLAGLALLTRQGVMTTDQGTVKVGGIEMHQYGLRVGTTSTASVVSRHDLRLPQWLANPMTQSPLGALSMTLDVNAAGSIGRIAFTTSATQNKTFAIVRATETVSSYGSPVTIVVPSRKQLTFVNALAGTLTRYCAPAPGLRLGPSSKPIASRP